MSSTTNGSANGSLSTGLDQHDASATFRQNLRPDPIRQLNAGGIGRSEFVDFNRYSDNGEFWFERPYNPGEPKSLVGIATRAFYLGFVLSATLICTSYVLVFTASPLWRVPFFLSTIALFHFLEFWTTAKYNTRAAQISSFLISQNGSAYQIAHTAASIESLLINIIFPDRLLFHPLIANVLLWVGLALVVIGQAVRTAAMIQAGTNFNHVVQYQKAREHQLVTTGVYGYLRHPSYFGFFWWALGTQLVLGNVICLAGYTAVLWRFFSRRISGEEEFLVAFFGEDYVKYRERTHAWIPFIR